MARDLTVRARIVAVDDASTVIGRVEGRFARFGSFLSRNLLGVTVSLAGAVAALGTAFKTAFTEAAEAEVTAKRFELALSRLGVVAQDLQATLDRQAAVLSRSTTATDDQVRSIQTLLLNLDTAPEKIEAATQAAVDLAATFNLDLNQAAEAVGRSLQGQGRELGRLVPEIRALDEAALRAGEQFEILAQKIGGSSAAQLETTTGRITGLKNALLELAESYGQPIAQSSFFRDLIRQVTNIVIAATPATVNLAKANEELGASTRSVELNYQSLAGSLAQAVLGFDALLDAEKRAARISREQEAAQLDFLSTLSKAGVVLRDFVTEQEQLEAALESTRTAYRDGRIDLEQYEDVTRKISEALAKLAVDVSATVAGVAELTVSQEDGRIAAESYATALGLTGREANLAADAFARATSNALALDRATRVTGINGSTEFGGTLTGGSILFPNSAIANTRRVVTTQGGTRSVRVDGVA